MQSAIAGRSGLYAALLGGLTWLALTLYVQFPAGTTVAHFGWLINLGLIGIIWWSAYRLTWDCTLIDEEEDSSGVGLLDAAGLDQSKGWEENELEADNPPDKKKKKGGWAAWWERFQEYQEQQKKKPKAHGIWVVYFSLAALPLFGIGQSLIPPEDLEKRRWVFWLMGFYVASGLGLLLTTAFLNLRRYLRQRNLPMPTLLTGSWLMVGAILIGALLLIGAFIPRPYPEYSLLPGVSKVTSPDRKPSPWALLKDSAVKGEGTPGEGLEKNENAPQGQGQKGESQPGEGQKPSSGSNQGDSSSENSQGDPQSGDSSGKGEGNRSGQSGQNQKTSSSQGKTQKGTENQKETDKENDSEPNQSGSTQQAPSGTQSSPPWIQSIAQILKWIVLALIVLMVLFFLLRSGLNFLANFTFWARGLLNWFQNFWNSLWNWNTTKKESQNAGPTSRKTNRVRPFSWYKDPFLIGTAEQMSTVEVIRYSFQALEAWAREHQLERPGDETPSEFARRLGQEVPELKPVVRKLAKHYVTVAYAPFMLEEECWEDLRQFWLTLGDVATQDNMAV